MPSTQEKKKLFERVGLDLSGAGGEPLGETPAPRREVFRASRPLSEERIEEAIGQVRWRQAIAELDVEQRSELIDGLLAGMGDEHGQLPEAVTDRLLDGLIAGKRGEAEILGSDGVLGGLTRRLIERVLAEELSEHLGYPAGQAPPGGAGNSRNGGTPKTVLTANGPVRIDTPRDRQGRFEPCAPGALPACHRPARPAARRAPAAARRSD